MSNDRTRVPRVPRPDPMQRTPIYAYRARTWGTEIWTCPYSGHLNSSQLTPRQYSVRCDCNLRFIPGRVLYPSPSGPQSIPPDWVIPLRRAERRREDHLGMIEAFPLGDLSLVPWRRHNPVHVLVDPNNLTEFDVGLAFKTVRKLAEAAPGDVFSVARGVGAGGEGLARLGAAFLQVAAAYGY